MCSLRLDFEVFTIQGIGGTAQPDEGVCMDTFVVAVKKLSINVNIFP